MPQGGDRYRRKIGRATGTGHRVDPLSGLRAGRIDHDPAVRLGRIAVAVRRVACTTPRYHAGVRG